MDEESIGPKNFAKMLIRDNILRFFLRNTIACPTVIRPNMLGLRL